MSKTLYFLAPLFTIFIVYGSLTSNPDIPVVDINHIDKLYHTTAYFLLTVLWYLFFYKRFMDHQVHMKLRLSFVYKNWSRSIGIGAAFLCASIGGFIEIAQKYLATNRTMEFFDMIANLCGIVIALLVLKGISFASNVKKV